MAEPADSSGERRRGGTPETPPARLEGVVQRVVYAQEESAWSVVRLEVPGRRDPVTAVGNLLGVQPGESLRLSGRWIQDRKYGEQFQVSSCLTVKPATLVGLEKYLGSGLVPGIGPVMAARLVQRFGLGTLDVIESDPKRLAEVEGIGPLRSQRIQAAWVEQKDIKDVMVFLQSHGVSAAYASRIYKQYGARAIGVVKENPYRLAADIHGIGFATADGIAANLGLKKDSPRRADAGVMHALDRLAEEGHVRAPRAGLVEKAGVLLEIEPELVAAALQRLAAAGEVILEKKPAGDDRGEQADEVSVYLAALHAAETGFAAALRGLLLAPARTPSLHLEKALAWYESRHHLKLAPGQSEAVRRGLRSKVLVITGGPGTGKTTLVNAILRILEAKGVRILLAAPTGRAARRLGETTAREARTVHRLLEFNPRSGKFERHARHPLEADLVIIDEASMVDQVLAFHITAALPPACRLILVGDVDQLPSVGPGQVLADLIASGGVDVARLTEIFRQEKKSQIIVNAHRVNVGEMPLLDEQDENTDFFFFAREEPEEVLATVKNLVGERIPRRFGLHPVDDLQVLTPMNRGLLGTANLNTELQALLNPQTQVVQRGSRCLGAGDKVMQMRNNYDLEVFNGDIGRVSAVDPQTGGVEVSYDGRLVSYTSRDLDELVLAYACSIHKSQGNEYPGVVIPLHTQHYVMLERNLLYTAISRGRRLVVLVGNHRALSLAVHTHSVRRRHTGLAARLRCGTDAGP